jgi:inosine-uridine nucleoside N-ribohydrolase
VTLIAIGPFTDVACLQRAFPDDYRRLKEIIALVGSSDGTLVLDGISVVDFNFAMDPTALGEVIAGGHSVPITFLMFEVSQQGSLTNEVIGQWIASGTDAQQFYGQATQPHATYWDASFTQTDGQALFDAHTVHYFLQPDAYVCEDGMVATATVGGYPDTSASTSKNSLTVMPTTGTSPTPGVQNDGSTYTYTGPVRGCSGFAASGGVQSFEQAVADSITAVSPMSASSEWAALE